MGDVVPLDIERDKFIEQFDHDGITVTVVQNKTTKRYIGRFEDVRPTPFQTSAILLEDVRRKAIRLIDKLHGKR